MKKRAFTLVELIAVIAIIGLLAVTAMAYLGVARAKSRDARRLADISQIKTALDLFYRDEGRYPETITPGESLVGTLSSTTYMTKIPSNIAPRGDGDCPDSDYSYQRLSDHDFSLNFCLGKESAQASAGANIMKPSGLLSCIPQCSGKTCGDDGCGGSCGTCGADYTCSSNNCAYNCGAATASDADNNVYNTVAIGTQCWLTKNLNVGTMLTAGSHQGDAQNGVIQKYCYNNDTAICTTDGGLYQWHTIMGFPTSCDTTVFDNNTTGSCGGVTYTITTPHKGICPTGWHIPTDNEWHTLELYLTTPGNSCNNTRLEGADMNTECIPANTKLKPNGTSGFLGVMAGYGGSSGLPTRRGIDGFYMSVTTPANTKAINRYIYNTSTGYLRRFSSNKYLGMSVRCLKD